MAAPGYAQLLVVQGHDTKLDQLRYRHAHHPIQVALDELGAKLAKQQAAIDEVEVGKHELDRRQKKLTDEVSLIGDRRAEIDAKLYDGSVTGTKDLLVLQEDAKMLLERQTSVEDDEFEIMEELEPIEAEVEKLDVVRQDLANQITVQEAELEVALAEVVAETASIQAERDAAADLVSSELRAAYEQLRVDLEGIAIAEINGSMCTGCNLGLSAVAIDRMKKQPDDAVVTCPECGRLLIR
ncbi:MAG: putative nucleic acid-binding Zn-ribbon protein [Candidatus Poriferisodalaceae bacterium]|jgi:predicted  nucleic acid-binding Zn-ribbon protein